MERRTWPVPLSVLDRSSVRRGEDPASAVRHTVEFARRAEALGYRRFWVSEHHSVPGVAGSAPTVLAAAVASATSRIRVGTGGVMLPNHRPLVVAEQFGTLEALHPGRIDMGLGRSVGFTGRERAALGAGKEQAEQFPERLRELLGYFAGASTVHRGVHAFPAEGLRIPAFVLATGAGAAFAAEAGLALVIAQVSGVDTLVRHIDRYRTEFRPSTLWERPYVMVSAAVAVAETAEKARELLLPEAWSLVRSRTRGVFPPLLPPADLPEPTQRESAMLADVLRRQIHGTPATVRDDLAALVERTGADEVLITLSTHDREDQLDSYTRLAELAR
ncbi:MsnO8 family LLM class oxidoreductase [Saccharomonospora xinjiangensis]|uniref:MsnO8 family LLM class oxidoreductase n=1 Tax=Saccharomonospora xinjiangensis TaxID=75294 RepID=UPI00031A4AAF|nr:MsnO8 family LLM class oxidoreductase [Saccharomonospora xinjiangensis]